jgi:hypothetical protein
MVRFSPIFFAFFVLASPAMSQDNCKDVLSAAYDKNYNAYDERAYAAAKQSACSNSKSDTDISYLGSYGKFGLTHDEATAWCNGSSNFQYIDQKFRLEILKVHDKVIEEWGKCMTRLGAQLSVQLTADPKVVFLRWQYNSTNLRLPDAVVDDMPTSNLECKPKPKKINALQSVMCRRPNPYEAASVALNLKDVKSPDPIEIAAVPRPLRPKFDASGVYLYDRDNQKSVINVSQQNGDVSYSLVTPTHVHVFRGGYVSGTKIIGIQQRTGKNDNCESTQDVTIEVKDGRTICNSATLRAGSRQCDFPNGGDPGFCYAKAPN